MASMGYFDLLRFSWRVLQFKWEQHRLTTYTTEIIETAKGPVKGVQRMSIWGDAYYSFEKIPFAKPPLGDLRFRAPVPAEPWTEVRDCTGGAEAPMQSNVFFRKYKGSEDCLYLNVFTRNLKPDKPLPVMVWIYGGGFQIGEASRNMYSPDFFMTKDIVFVSIAYRLGPFGFLSLDDPAVDVPGNAGIKDQILSLKWVRDNISCFGGDPENVTVFGESAGGTSTHLCMLSEQSKGLIHKAIVMSGSALCAWATPSKSNWPLRLARALDYTGEDNSVDIYKFLLEVDGPELVRASGTLLTKEEKHNRIVFAFLPVVEPYVTEQCIMSVEPYKLLQTSWSNTIPMMIGGTSFEGLLFYPEIKRRPATLDEVKDCLNLLPFDINVEKSKGVEAEALGLKLKKCHFGDDECSQQTYMKFLELLSYREFWHPIYRTLLARLRYSTAPTYLYRFDYDSKDGNAVRNLMCGKDVRGCCHGDDLCYLFYAMFTNKMPQDSTECHIIRTMIDIWTSFATKSDPNCESLQGVQFEPLNQPSTASGEMPVKCLNISEKLEFIELPEMPKLKVWNSIYPAGKL